MSLLVPSAVSEAPVSEQQIGSGAVPPKSRREKKTRRGEINERRRRKRIGVKESVKESKKERSTHTDTQKKRVRHFAKD